jgi:hypothetical protein
MKKGFEAVCLSLADYRGDLQSVLPIPDIYNIIQDYLVNEEEFEWNLADLLQKRGETTSVISASRRITRMLDHVQHRHPFVGRWWKTLLQYVKHASYLRFEKTDIIGCFFGTLVDRSCNRPWCWGHIVLRTTHGAMHPAQINFLDQEVCNCGRSLTPTTLIT